MRFSANELNTVLEYIRSNASGGLLLLEGYPAVAKQTGLRAGRVAGIFYFLCGEGNILQEGKKVLLLDGTPFPEDENQ